MVALSGWSEPLQNPEFDEYILMVRSSKQIEIEGETVTLKVSESLLVHKKGARVRLWCLPMNLQFCSCMCS